MSLDLSHMRREYMARPFVESQLLPSPLAQFESWFAEAHAAQVPEPNAMTLATVDTAGAPRARIVLLKGVEENRFTFFTNFESQKGLDIEAHHKVQLSFYWGPLFRQVQVHGTATRLCPEAIAHYFATRPRGSQIGAWASHQSHVVSSREELERAFARFEAQFAGQEVPVPPNWGGYAVTPHAVEFWQGRESRLHDRLLYQRSSESPSGWTIVRLCP